MNSRIARGGIDAFFAALDSEPAGRVFVSPPPDPAELAAAEEDLQLTLPAEVRQIYEHSNGVGLARPSTSLYVPSIAGFRRLNFDDLYTAAFPGMVILGDDGASGLFVIDQPGRSGYGPGAVLLTDRGSLQPADTAVAGRSVSKVLWAVFDGEDLWDRPRLA